MTPTQEVCNAATMLLPTLVFAREAALRWPNPWLVCLLGGSVMHAPASVAYHLRAACVKRQEDRQLLLKADRGNSELLKVNDNSELIKVHDNSQLSRVDNDNSQLSRVERRHVDRVENGDLCRLDQSLMHVSGAVFAFALSRGSVPYTLAHASFGAHAVSVIWRPRRQQQAPEHRERRWVHVAVSVWLWLLPMAASGHWVESVAGGAAFYAGGLCFVQEVNERFFGGWGHALFHLAVACTAKCMCDAC